MAAVVVREHEEAIARHRLRPVTGGEASWFSIDRPADRPADRPGAAHAGAAHAGFARPLVRLPARTYRRRQAVAAGLVAGLVLALWAALGLLGAGPLPASGRPSAAPASTGGTYVVQAGDSLWSIAEGVHPGADPRPFVDRLAAINGGSTIYVGERITIPGGS